MKLHGHEAIDYAEEHGLTLSKYNDPIEGARDGLTIDEAKDVAREDPSLIYIEIADDVYAQHRADAYDADQL